MSLDEKGYYDLAPLLAYNADVNAIIYARGLGKTFSLRKHYINTYLKSGIRFLAMTRYKNELSKFSEDFFAKVQNEGYFENYHFRYDIKGAYIEKKKAKPKDGKKADTKSVYHQIGYFGALTEAQNMKKRTFVNVREFELDEAFIDFTLDKYHNYLPNELEIIANIIDSASRERADNTKLRKPRLFLMANAVDLVNPYFIHYGIKEPPPEGFSWHGNKTFLVDYMKTGEYSYNKQVGTVAGRILANSVSGAANVLNEFYVAKNGLIKRKTANAKFDFGYIYKQQPIGVWLDLNEGYYYISRKIPNNTNRPIFSLLGEDGNINYIAADRMNKVLRGFGDLFYKGCIRFEDEALRRDFLESMKMYGVR